MTIARAAFALSILALIATAATAQPYPRVRYGLSRRRRPEAASISFHERSRLRFQPSSASRSWWTIARVEAA